MYAKVFSQIFDSSIAEDCQVRWVFEDLLVLANRDGVVDMTHEAVARKTNVPLEIIQRAITKLESPDPKSRTADFDGSRIHRLDDHRDWGWFIVNFDKYHTMANDEQYRAGARERMRRMRDRQREKRTKREKDVHSDSYSYGTVTERNGYVTGVTERNNTQQTSPSAPEIPKKEAFKKPTIEEVKLVAAKSGLPDSEAEKFFHHYESNGWKVGKNPMKSLNSAVAGWAVRWRENGGNLNGHPKSLMDKQIDATHAYVQRVIGDL